MAWIRLDQGTFGRIGVALLLAMAGPTWAGVGLADDGAGASGPASDLTALIAQAHEAREHFVPFDADRVEETHKRAIQASHDLHELLARGTEENLRQWEAYLQWEVIQEELAKSSKPDLRKLQSAWRKFYANEVGLEMASFTAFRESLFEYMISVSMAGNEDLRSAFEQRMDALIEGLTQYAESPSDESGQRIGPAVGWLRNAGQATALVEGIGKAAGHANLYAECSQELAAGGVRSEVEETTDVRDVILGTRIFGTATLHGQTDLVLMDDDQRAAFAVQLSGQIDSVNRGYNRGVTIRSTALTDVQATKRILFDPMGITTFDADADCRTKSHITGISAKSCLMEKIARRRVGKSKGQAEQVASRHAARRVEERINDQVEELLADVRERYQENFRLPLLRRGEFPQEMALRTQDGRLQLAWRQANAYQLAAPTQPPPLTAKHDAAVRLHESFVSNFSRALLGGVTLTDERLVEIFEESGGEVPEELKIDQDKEPWSIRFSATQPVSARFSAGTLRFAIRGSRFVLGDRTVNNTLEMSAVYKLEKTESGARLTRQGDVNVEYMGLKGRLSPLQITIRTVMRKKFQAIFEAEFDTKGVKLPGRWEQSGSLKLAELASQEGWLKLSWLRF